MDVLKKRLDGDERLLSASFSNYESRCRSCRYRDTYGDWIDVIQNVAWRLCCSRRNKHWLVRILQPISARYSYRVCHESVRVRKRFAWVMRASPISAVNPVQKHPALSGIALRVIGVSWG
jgi:hypothetical protein